ncbi:MAG: EAL domain-containing protein [Pseudomonadota bacterium]
MVFFTVLWIEESYISKNDRMQLVRLTESFVAVYSENRAETADIPAEFRRKGLQHFSSDTRRGENRRSHTTVRMSGRPGLEIESVENDLRLSNLIASFVDDPSLLPIHEQRLENWSIIARTLVPSVASSAGCVSCHNQILGEDAYRTGDVMGAYVVERDLTGNMLNDLKYAVVWFLVSLFFFCAIAFRERSRNLHVMQLKSRVKLEKIKSEADAKERFLLSHDTLTGLPNRKLFNEHMTKIFNNKDLPGLTVALIDLDDFKMVNDTMGHAAGDALLVEVAQRLQAATRPEQAMVARLGGDEFAIAWHSDPTEHSEASVGARILETVVRPLEFETWLITPHCSIGIATSQTGTFETPSNLLKSADAALYVAKERGKNTYQLFDQAIDASIRRKNDIALTLPKSIRNGDIQFAFQPKVSLQDGHFHGFEALARWTYDGQEISPEEFVKIAEGAGVVKDLDLLVLERAAARARALEDQTGVTVCFSVNLSAKSCQMPHLTEEIQDILWRTQFPPDQLTVEVTETCVIDNLKVVKNTLQKLRKIGIRMSLDDFGTGYSSLAYLTQIDFDEVKVDREFVRDIETSSDKLTLLTHLADMLSALEIDLVIEGIETQEQVDLMPQKGHWVGQGFFFSGPLKEEETVDYLMNLPDRHGRQARA